MRIYRRVLQTGGWVFERSALVVGALLIALMIWTVVSSMTASLQAAIAPVPQTDLARSEIYAYRDWQSVGKRIGEGNLLQIEAGGSWLYTPGDYHGPQGHPRFLAPSFYPVSGPGGALLGRIGENGQPFYVGPFLRTISNDDGLLYLRINDDVLSDNDGVIQVDITVRELD